METKSTTDQEFQLGVGGLARFLRLHRSGDGDYTRDRDKFLANVSLDEIIQQIRSAEPEQQELG